MAKPKLTETQRAEAISLMGGDMSDEAIGRKFGVSYTVIGRLRRKHGIPAMTKEHLRFKPTEAQLAELHETSDREMARRYTVATYTWRKTRRRYGVPAFRPPTVINGVGVKVATGEPNVKREKSEGFNFKDYFKPSPIPPRDSSLAGEAASFLRREGFVTYDRARIKAGEGWQVGHSVLSSQELIAKASKLGFQREEWMV